MTKLQKTEDLLKNLHAAKIDKSDVEGKIFGEVKDTKYGSVSLESFQDQQEGVLANKSPEVQGIVSDIMSAMAATDAKHLGNESFDGTPAASAYTKAQIKAGVITGLAFQNKKKLVQTLAGDLSASLEGFNATGAKVDSAYGTSVSASDMLKGISMEAFDGTSNFSSVYYNIAVNVESARADDFSEAFFPTVVIGPDEVGISIGVTFTSFVSDYIRNASGEPVAQNTKSLIKHAYNSDVLLKDKTKIIPKFIKGNTQNNEAFLEEGKIEVQSDEGNFETAPLLVNQERDVIGLSLANSLSVGQGVADRTDSLYPSIRVVDIYFMMKTANSADNLIKIPVGGIQGTAFLYNNQGHFKGLALTLNNSEVSLKIGNGLPTGFNGNVQDFNTDLDAYKDYTIVIGFGLNGTASMDKGTVAVNVLPVSIKRAYNAQGVELTDVELQPLVQAVNKLDLVAYDLEAYRTNTNLRTKGQLLQIDTWINYRPIPYTSGFSVTGPTVNYTGSQNDINHIVNTADACNLKSNAAAVETLIATARELKALVGNKSEVFTNYPSDKMVDPFYKESTLDMKLLLDSLSSSDRRKDIKEAMRSFIMNEAVQMFQAGYMNAHNLLGNAGKKAVVLIGTDFEIAQYLLHETEGNTFDLTDSLKAMVVWTPNPDMKGKIFMTFSATDKIGEIDTVNTMHFGIRAFSPVITLDYQRNNGGIIKEVTSVPRYLHIPLLPVLNVVDVVNVTSGIVGKVAFDVVRRTGLNP